MNKGPGEYAYYETDLNNSKNKHTTSSLINARSRLLAVQYLLCTCGALWGHVVDCVGFTLMIGHWEADLGIGTAVLFRDIVSAIEKFLECTNNILATSMSSHIRIIIIITAQRANHAQFVGLFDPLLVLSIGENNKVLVH